MQLFKNFIKTLVDNYIFIGVCSVFFYLSGFLLIHETHMPDYIHISLVFWSTLTIYYFNTGDNIHIIHLVQPQSRTSKVKSYIIFILVIITSIHFFFIPFTETIYLSHLGVISVLYNMPKPENLKILPLRGIPLLKIFLIAYVWAGIGITFPALQSGHDIWQPEILKLFAAEFFFILSITLPFDIRDYYSDHIDEPRTLAHLLGIRHTIAIAIISLGIFTLLIWPFLNTSIFFITFIILVASLIFYSTPHKNKYYYTILLDGTMILYYFVLMLTIN